MESSWIPPAEDRPFTCARITLSDKGSAGQREDKSGPLIDKMMSEAGYEMIESVLIPDDYDMIRKELIRIADQRQADLILTTGGTGSISRLSFAKTAPAAVPWN